MNIAVHSALVADKATAVTLFKAVYSHTSKNKRLLAHAETLTEGVSMPKQLSPVQATNKHNNSTVARVEVLDACIMLSPPYHAQTLLFSTFLNAVV